MSDQMADREVEQAFSQWIDQAAPSSPPTRILESTFVRTMGTRQLRVYPWNRFALGRGEATFSGSGAGFGIAVLTLLIVVAMAAGFVGGALRPTGTPSPSPSPTAAPSLPAAISVPVGATIAIADPLAMASDGELLWVRASGGRFYRIDPDTTAVAASATIDPATDVYVGLAINTDGLWTTYGDNATVYRLDPQTLAVDATIVAGLAPRGVLANADGIWVADVHGGKVLRIDPATNEVAATIKTGLDVSGGPSWLAQGLDSVWVDSPRNRTIDRVDPFTDIVQATIQAPAEFTPCGGIAVAADSAWVTSCWVGTAVARIDANSNEVVATIDIHGHGHNPTTINDSVWVSVDGGTADSGKLVRIDAATNTIDRVLVPSIEFGGGGDIVVAGGSVWVVDGYHDAVIGLPLSAFAP